MTDYSDPRIDLWGTLEGHIILEMDDPRKTIALEQLARLREREADWAASVDQEQSHLHHCRGLLDAAEARVAELTHLMECADTPLMRDVLAERNTALARVAELEQQVASATQACNVAVAQAMKLEEALKEIAERGPGTVASNRARRALAHKEETSGL